MDKPKVEYVKYTIEIEPEPESPEDGFMDDEAVKWVRAEIAAGNQWGWCVVIVKAEFMGFTGSDSLGACSYKSQADFEHGGYYESMKQEALSDLRRRIDHDIRCGIKAQTAKAILDKVTHD